MRNDRNEGNYLDNLLDVALASYTGEPRAALDARIIQHVRAAQRRRRWMWGSWAALPAACLAIGMVVWTRDEPAPEARKAVQIKASAPVVIARSRERQKPVRALPKRAQFRSREPLTRRERGLVVFARSAPEEAQRMTEDMRPIEIEPLQVGDLRVQPLPEEEAPDESGN